MKRKSARSRLKIEQLEARINLSAVDIGFGTGNFDFNVAGYNIEQNNANFATTSSAFGFSEASMTAAQAVDTLNGGTEMAALSDAFDGFMSWEFQQPQELQPRTHITTPTALSISRRLPPGPV